MKRIGSMATLVAFLMRDNLVMKLFEAQRRARRTKRVRHNTRWPHYGVNAAVRSLHHAKAGTHGLKMVDGHIVPG